MYCRPRVSLPFIPSTCLILADTSGNATHVLIKNRSIKILSASCGHHSGRLRMAARDNRKASRSHACGSLLGDATGVAIIRYAEWEDAKKGVISRREFVKLHIVTDVKGRKIASCTIASGRAHDSPVFRKMIKKFLLTQDVWYLMQDMTHTRTTG